MKPNHCAIVADDGPDVFGKTSSEIAPHGIWALWEQIRRDALKPSNPSIVFCLCPKETPK